MSNTINQIDITANNSDTTTIQHEGSLNGREVSNKTTHVRKVRKSKGNENCVMSKPLAMALTAAIIVGLAIIISAAVSLIWPSSIAIAVSTCTAVISANVGVLIKSVVKGAYSYA